MTFPVWSYNDALFWARRLSGLLVITEQAWLEMTALGRLTPIEYELIMTQTANQAA